MPFHDEYRERLMTRQLDGELTEAEEAEFSRLLEESEEFSATWEEMRRINEQCSDLLDSMFPIVEGMDANAITEVVPEQTPSSKWVPLFRAVVPMALAACIAIAFIPSSNQNQVSPADGGSAKMAINDNMSTTIDPSIVSKNSQPTPAMPANFLRPTQIDPDELRQARTNRSTNSEWIGVRGKDGQIYWVELKHTRTTRRAGLTDGAKLAGTHY